MRSSVDSRKGPVALVRFKWTNLFYTIRQILLDTDMTNIHVFRNFFANNSDVSTAFHISTTIHPVAIGAIWSFYLRRGFLNLILIKRSALDLYPETPVP
jgi:hypothetical protein